MRKLLFVFLYAIGTVSSVYSQQKSKILVTQEFIKAISNVTGNPNSSGYNSIDVYSVAIVLNFDGRIQNVLFSDGMPDFFKDILVHQLHNCRIGNESLEEYWKKYCKLNAIHSPTCIIQTALVRCDETDSLRIATSELENKVRLALTFKESPFLLSSNFLFIWLDPIIKRLPREQIVF